MRARPYKLYMNNVCTGSRSTVQYCTHFLRFFPHMGPKRRSFFRSKQEIETLTEVHPEHKSKCVALYMHWQLRWNSYEEGVERIELWFWNFRYHTSESISAIQHDLRRTKH
jgi:hypothetical protein